MKNYKYKFFIFIASLIIGFLGSINFNINSMSSLFKMNAQEYKNASEERNMLYESISDLISDGTVTYKKAVDKFKENVDNHNINRPIVIVPLDINFSVSEEERVNQIQDYEKLKDKVDEYNDIIDDLCELNKDLKKVYNMEKMYVLNGLNEVRLNSLTFISIHFYWQIGWVELIYK